MNIKRERNLYFEKFIFTLKKILLRLQSQKKKKTKMFNREVAQKKHINIEVSLPYEYQIDLHFKPGYDKKVNMRFLGPEDDQNLFYEQQQQQSQNGWYNSVLNLIITLAIAYVVFQLLVAYEFEEMLDFEWLYNLTSKQ